LLDTNTNSLNLDLDIGIRDVVGTTPLRTIRHVGYRRLVVGIKVVRLFWEIGKFLRVTGCWSSRTLPLMQQVAGWRCDLLMALLRGTLCGQSIWGIYTRLHRMCREGPRVETRSTKPIVYNFDLVL